MADDTTNTETTEEAGPRDTALEGGAYDVLRKRLQGLERELLGRVDKLNAERKEVFGGTESAIIGTARIKTEHNCLARDVVSIGTHLIVGFEVVIGMKSEVKVTDMFGVYEVAGEELKQVEPALLADATFQRDFSEIFRYYQKARFLQFIKQLDKLLFIFQVGATEKDVKVVRWRIGNDQTLHYIDDRGDQDYKLPAQQDFGWTKTTRDDQVFGEHPHVSIEDRVFVECVGGDLTIKIENNTASGEGIYAEPVENADQTLDDAHIWYARIGSLILLRVQPYMEDANRYFIFNPKTETAVRQDSIEQACVQLPEGHGIIFPKGCYLESGDYREFQERVEGMGYHSLVRSPNGEDFLYIFYQRESGAYVLLQYNLIAKRLENPIFCIGYSLYDDGRMLLCTSPDRDPKRIHTVQIWQTPFYSDTHQVVQQSDSYLDKIGNRDLVRAIADCTSISRLVNRDVVNILVYQELVDEANGLLDGYHWLGHDSVFNLREIVVQIKTAALAAVDEFDKVERIRRTTREQIDANAKAAEALIKEARFGSFRTVDDFVTMLNQLRSRRGQVISLRELRFADQERIARLEEQLEKATHELSLACIDFLLRPSSFDSYFERVADVEKKTEAAGKVADILPLEATLEELSQRLDLLTDVVNNLQIDDTTKTTRIVDAITDVFAAVNRGKAMARNRRQDLGRRESSAEFAAQFKLLSQSINNYIGLCDTPAKCDDYLTKLMVQVEELEGRFVDFEEFVEQLSEKREEAYAAFVNRKQLLEEERKRRVNSLLSSAERILKGIRNRAESFKTVDDVNAYYAADLMVAKLRDIIDKLQEYGDSVKADDLLGQLKSSKDATIRKLRDKIDLFDEGENLIKFGEYRFTVNTQPLELTTIYRDDATFFHLTGTDFYERITDPDFLLTRDLWEQSLVSENREVYRAEYLAYIILKAAVSKEAGLNLEELIAAANDEEAKPLAELVHRFASDRYNEGYDKGIHDHDATLILRALVNVYNECELLRYDSTSRAHAIIFWCYYADDAHKQRLRNKLRSYGQMGDTFDYREPDPRYIGEIHTAMHHFFGGVLGEVDPTTLRIAAEYLFYELQDQAELLFTVNALAHQLYKRFDAYLHKRRVKDAFLADVAHQQDDLANLLSLTHHWVATYVRTQEGEEHVPLVWEVVALIAAGDVIEKEEIAISTYRVVKGCLGQHPLIKEKQLPIHLDRWLLKMNQFANERVPRFQQYLQLRTELTARRRHEMRLHEFQSKVLGSFVRNKLINDLYLGLVGANFAKQMGAAGEGKRTDLMGMLLLISPPGYGKTTLMEYIANRLGLTFMKINGPAIGHGVTSLDPVEAPNATAREELGKLNLALEMGNNIMLYVDDIQHCNPEFLQKFISLCDAQRRIEGVYRGQPKSYDLRGKKVAVVMAGNPYTESGDKFKIPDMLANRADTYNLGDISASARDLFELSFIENAMTSNQVLTTIASRSHEDLYRFMQILATNSREGIQFDHDYSAAEVTEILGTLKKLRRVQQILLRVNEQYIYSAAQQDDYRKEPPFKLQGSYRNMNRLAEKVFPVMTDQEVDQLIIDHYYNESQTLTTGAEANLLKFKELMDVMSEDERRRWEDIKSEFNRRQMLSGMDDSDQMGQVLGQLSAFNAGLGNIRTSIDRSLESGLRQLAGRLVEGQQLDLSPLVDAVTRIGERQPQLNLTPLIEAMRQPPALQANFPKEYAKAWERQITAVECLVPILESIKLQNDTFLQLKVVMQEILEGRVHVRRTAPPDQ